MHELSSRYGCTQPKANSSACAVAWCQGSTTTQVAGRCQAPCTLALAVAAVHGCRGNAMGLYCTLFKGLRHSPGFQVSAKMDEQ